jgi:hypothetical protein
MSVSSYVGGGRHGHLGIIITQEEYFAIAANFFTVPNSPGASAEVVEVIMATVIAETTRIHREATQVYRTYHNVEHAINKLTVEAFDDAYLNALSYEIMGYANCASLQLLTHILTYHTNQPIETLFQQIQDARAFVVAGGQPYSFAMITNVAYTLIFNRELFTNACRA